MVLESSPTAWEMAPMPMGRMTAARYSSNPPVEFGQAEFIDILNLEHLLYDLQGDLSYSGVDCHVSGPQEKAVQDAGDATAF